MTVAELRVEIARREGGKREVNIADISEILKVLKDIILEKSGLNLYNDIIRKI